MYYDDHNPPHFHARYGEYTAEIGIGDCSVIEGNLPPRVLGFVTEWASLHRNELVENWERLKKDQELISIEPLK